MKIKSGLLVAAVSVLLSSAPAFATTFTFGNNKAPGSAGAGHINLVKTTFNNNKNLLTWTSTIGRNANGVLADGGWLVISDGNNPKGTDTELAAYFLDGINKKVSIYNYNGKNNDKSWKDGHHIATIDLDVLETANEVTHSFSLDTTKLNGLTNFGSSWKGTSFDHSVGIWFHPTDITTVAYDDKGALTQFSHRRSSGYDVANKETTAVPEPASAAAIGLFAAAAAFIKRKQTA